MSWLRLRAREIAEWTWSTPARACWGEPPQLSTENHLRKEFEGLDHSSLRMWLFVPLDQELCVIWEACVNGGSLLVRASPGDWFYYGH